MKIFRTAAGDVSCLAGSGRTGPPLLFVHGLGGASSDFEALARQDYLLERPYLIPDLIGFGQSSKPPEFSYNLEDQADVLKSLLDQAGISKIDCVAHSMGAVTAVLLAGKYPRAIRKLILAEPNFIPENATISARIVGYGDEPDFCSQYGDFVQRFNKPGSPSASRFYQTLARAAPYALYRSAASLLRCARPPFFQGMLSLETQKYFIRGETSWMRFSPEHVAEIKSRFDGYFIIPGAGHGMMGDNPEGFGAVLREILTDGQ